MSQLPASPSARTAVIDGITLHLAQPIDLSQDWIGSREPLQQLLACWLKVDPRDLHQLLIAAGIAQGDHRLNETRGHDGDGNLAMRFVNADNVLAKRLGNRIGDAFV